MNVDMYWTYFPGRKELKRSCPHKIYEDANDYCADHVPDAKLAGNSIIVPIQTSSRVYPVIITDRDARISGDCPCSNGKKRLWCWHNMAALLYVSDHINELKEEEMERHDKVDYFMANIPHAKILNFVSKNLKTNYNFYETFLEDLDLQNVQVPRNYTRLLDNICEDRTSYDMVNFKPIFNVARASRNSGDYLEASRAYRNMSEYIIKNIKEDPDGYYKDCAIVAIDSMVDSIISKNLKPDKKTPFIKYFFKRATNPIYHEYWPQYTEALEIICIEEEDRARWLELINSGLKAKAGSPQQMARMQAYVLEDSQRWEEAADALLDHYESDSDTCKRFVRILRHVDKERALQHGQKVVSAFWNDLGVMEEVLPIFTGSNDEYQRLLMHLFESTGDWKYFFKLKEIVENWNEALDKMSNNLVKLAPERAIDMYLKESMRQEAMDMLVQLNDHVMYAKYAPKLAKKFPEKYFKMYGECIRRFARSRTGKDHYDRVMKHLQDLQSFSELEKFKTLLATIKSENSGRPLLLRMLNSAQSVDAL